MPVGSTVSFPNNDPVFHNVFSLSNSKSFDLGNYPKGHTRTVTFTKPGIVFVNCHLHPNMSAAILVSPNQWSTKADKAGHFKLQDVPPGKYTVVATSCGVCQSVDSASHPVQAILRNVFVLAGLGALLFWP